LLIAKGADVNAKNNLGGTPLDKMFETSLEHLESINLDVVDLLIAKGVQLKVNNIFKRIKVNNANINANIYGQLYQIYRVNPLHVAAGLGGKDIVDLLIAKGANINAKDDEGLTPLDWATVKSHANIVELLKSRGGIGSCRNLDELRVVCRGNPIRTINNYTYTFLYYIRQKNSSKICRSGRVWADSYPTFLEEQSLQQWTDCE
jgi:cytohesin